MTFKTLLQVGLILLVNFNLCAQNIVERWGVFELNFKSLGSNISRDDLTASFFLGKDTISVKGFYDGNDVYKIRFMPSKMGVWGYSTYSPNKMLIKTGTFSCVAASSENHGPVRVDDTFYFAYSDNKIYHPIGTTIYGWLEYDSTIQKQTIETLKKSPFNKVRFKILGPNVNGAKQAILPFKLVNGKIDYSNINPTYFQAIESGIIRLGEFGIEADLITLHPYDAETVPNEGMTMNNIYDYLDYIIARFGVFRNVWWTTNEFDLLKGKSMNDWDKILNYIKENDPYHHLISNHNSDSIRYDHSKSWISHVSLQAESWWEAQPLREKYLKPVIFDELCYEGDGDNRTIALEGEVLTHRFWLLTVNGAFGTHGEAIINPKTGFWFFGDGGELLGNSFKQLETLKKVIETAPGHLKPISFNWRLSNILCGIENKYYLYYFGEYQNKTWQFEELPENGKFHLELIDTRTGNITSIPGDFKKHDKIKLPGKSYMAMVLQRIP